MSINIPLDQVLRGSSIKTVTTANTPYTGAKVGDKYVEFLFQNNNTPQYLPVQDLVDVYKGDGTYIEVSASNVIQLKYDALKNRLKTDFDAVYDAKGAGNRRREIRAGRIQGQHARYSMHHSRNVLTVNNHDERKIATPDVHRGGVGRRKSSPAQR